VIFQWTGTEIKHNQSTGTATILQTVHRNRMETEFKLKVKVAHTRLPSAEFRSWSRFLAVSLQVTWVINLAVGSHYFLPGLQARGTMGVNRSPKTVTRQRCGCDLNPGPSAPKSSILTTRLPSHRIKTVELKYQQTSREGTMFGSSSIGKSVINSMRLRRAVNKSWNISSDGLGALLR